MSLAHIADRIAASTLAAMKRGAPPPKLRTVRDCCDLAHPELPVRSRERLAGLIVRRLKKAGHNLSP